MNIRNNSATNALGTWLLQEKDKYKVLSKTEEKELIRKYRDDPEELRSLLVRHNIRLVFSMAKKYASTSIDFDEMIGRGFEGLCYAAKKFDLNRNIKFVTYATPWVFKYLLKEYFDKDVMASKTGVSLDSAIKDVDNSGATFANIVHNYVDPNASIAESNLSVDQTVDGNEKYLIYSDLVEYVRKNKNFDDLDREIFQRNLINKDSIKTISADLNIQYAQTSKRKKEILQKLKSYLSEKYGINSVVDL